MLKPHGTIRPHRSGVVLQDLERQLAAPSLASDCFELEKERSAYSPTSGRGSDVNIVDIEQRPGRKCREAGECVEKADRFAVLVGEQAQRPRKSSHCGIHRIEQRRSQRCSRTLGTLGIRAQQSA